MIINGIDLDGLAHDAELIYFPEQVKGRTVHIDADFLAYQCTFEKKGEYKSYEDMQHNAEQAVDTLRSLAAAEFVHLHLTPSTSNKGGRYGLAIQKPYQGNRVDKPKPRYLGIMREWLAKRYTGTLHQFCEADDGMSSAQYKAIKEGNRDLSIIASKDKDLSMVPGLHVDWDTGEIVDAGDFGTVWHDTAKNKLKGFGQKFFWAQMLTGDTADNIQGLPAVTAPYLNVIKPTKDIEKAQAILQSPNSNPAQKAKALLTLSTRKPGACGPATAIRLLEDMTNHKRAFSFVKELYQDYGKQVGFKHYSDGRDIPWGNVLVSEAQLLWMRIEPHNENCVLAFMKEIA